MKILSFSFSILVIISGFTLHAQTVSTFYQLPSSGDVALDKDGNLIVADGTSILRKIWRDGSRDTVFFSGNDVRKSMGLAFDPTGEILYVACCPNRVPGWVTRINPNGSTRIINMSTGSGCPKDLAADSLGNLYLTVGSNDIKKISPQGSISNYVTGSNINTPMGIVWSPGNTLYVSSSHNGSIYKVTPGSPPVVSYFALVPGLTQLHAYGYMTYRNGYLYITNAGNIVYQISMKGVVTAFAGDGVAGWVDGPASTARFNAPRGICALQGSDSIFVTEEQQYQVRVISNVSTNLESGHQWSVNNFQIYPNPAVSKVYFSVELGREEHMSLNIYTQKGEQIKTVFQKKLPPGKHEFLWDRVNSKGQDVAAGNYYAVLRAGMRQQSLQVILN